MSGERNIFRAEARREGEKIRIELDLLVRIDSARNMIHFIEQLIPQWSDGGGSVDDIDRSQDFITYLRAAVEGGEA